MWRNWDLDGSWWESEMQPENNGQFVQIYTTPLSTSAPRYLGIKTYFQGQYSHIHSNITHESSKVGTIQISTNW